MRRPVLLAFAALTLVVLPAAAQTTPRRPPADTLRFGTTRPAAGDSIQMAEYQEDEGATDTIPVVEEASDIIERERPKPGPYSRSGGSGPFSVQASGEPSASRPERGDVVWLDGRAARPAAADSARRDTARASTRVAAGSTARRDSASSATNRPARRDSAAATSSRPARRDTASTPATRPSRSDTAASAANRVARRDTASPAGRPAARDTAGGRRTSTSGTSGASSTTGRTTTTGASGGSAAARPRTHTIEAGETFYALARRYGVTAAQLRAVNPDVVMDSLEIGDVLRLPAAARDTRASGSAGSGSTGSTAQRPATQPRPSSSTPSTQRRTHTVVAGETLFGIARRYGVSANAIREANEMETDQVRTGQRLVIPPAR